MSAWACAGESASAGAWLAEVVAESAEPDTKTKVGKTKGRETRDKNSRGRSTREERTGTEYLLSTMTILAGKGPLSISAAVPGG